MGTNLTLVDPWHYARPELAQEYLRMFAVGLTSARALFAKRRMGKSEFLEKDLIPAAQAEGYRTAYLNLWDAREAPTTALASVIGKAMAPRGMARMLGRLNAPLKSVKASGKLPGLGEASLEATLVDDRPVAGPLLSDLLRDWDKPKAPLLLVLDEAQVLAEARHSDLAHSLRAGLDVRKQTIKVVFAGSSEPTLRRMFARHSEPFYRWAPLEPFKLLGEDFVRAMVDKVNERTRFPLALPDALLAFDHLERTPEFFRHFLNSYLVDAPQGWRAALERTRASVFNDQNFQATWRQLLPADKSVLRLLADGTATLQAEATRKRLGTELGVPVVSPATVQNALARLVKQSLLTKVAYGRYAFVDEAFADWVLHVDLDDRA